jgi:hypothetical protein
VPEGGIVTVLLRGGIAATFFEPTDDGMARNAEGAAQTPQAGAFLVGAQNQLALLFRVALRTSVGRRAPPALAAAEALAAVRRFAVANDIGALAMRTGNNKGDQAISLIKHRALNHYPNVMFT